jgi:hypothetical protein
MSVVSYPWYILPAGDWYLRSIIVNGSGIETVKVYISTNYDGDPQTPAVTKTFNPAFSGKRINFDLRSPFVKIRAEFEGTSVKIMDMYYNAFEKRIV